MKRKPIIQTIIISFLLILLIVINAVVASLFDVINGTVCGTYSTASEAEIAECLEDGSRLADEIEGEGIVMVKNDNLLPISSSIKKVNVFGWSSSSWIYGGSGSGRAVLMDEDFVTALQNKGIEYNKEILDFYKDFLKERPLYNNSQGSLNSHYDEFSRLYEPKFDQYSNDILNNAKNYSDTAIVVLSRVCGESNDCPKIQHKQIVKNGEIVTDETRTYLEISTEEEDLLKYVGANFDKTIVLVNSCNPIELGFLETIPGIDSCLIVGATGASSADVIADVIYGKINPSGKLSDTYAYDFSSAPSYVNAGLEGEGKYTNSEGLYPCGVHSANVGSATEVYDAVYYVDYVEDIYVGYRWYETADTEGYFASKGGYDQVVQFPFGYGLSYTSFKWDFVEAIEEEGKVTIKVKVTNIGDVAGKDVVQLYYNPPYTNGGIEKASVNLADFAKTKLLAKNESEIVSLTVSDYDMASYDVYDKNNNGFKGYELEAGTYDLMIKKNAHDDSEIPYYSYVKTIGTKFDKDPVTGNIVQNRFTEGSCEDCEVSIDGSNANANIKYLTRADFGGSFPKVKAADRAMADNVIEWNLYDAEKADEAINSNDEPIVTGQNNNMVVYDAEKGITDLGKKLGKDYDDPDWEKLLNQLDKDLMITMVTHLYLSPNVAIPSIGKYKVFESDGPTMIGSFNAARHGTGFANPVVTAQTFNKELAYKFGSQVALEAANLGMDGWYAPGINLHRTPFGGRNYEYYSEDPVLSGVFCRNVVKGAHERGIYCYVKHFVAYDQDGNRDSLYTWLTEQALREIYLKPFEIATKGGLTGVMTSYNRIGAIWTGGSKALITSVLRGEWGFRGAVLTDYADHPQYDSSDQCIRAGGDQVLIGFGSDVSFKFETSSNTFDQAIRSAAKNSIYIWLNALYKNSLTSTPRNLRVPSGGWLQPLLIILDILAFAGLAVWAFFIIKKFRG